MARSLLKCLLRLAPLMYMAAIWAQSAYFQPESVMHLPLTTLVPLGIVFEALHLVQFGILYGLLVLSLCTFGPLTKRKNTIAVAAAVLYALTDELHQYFVPFRSATVSDLVKNVIGIALVWLIIHKVSRSGNSSLWNYLSGIHKQ